jgi:hypothetical protein
MRSCVIGMILVINRNKSVISLNRMKMFFIMEKQFLYAEGTEFLNII